ncbi:unnamed protein product, partial [Rotaria sp. Silwood2]
MSVRKTYDVLANIFPPDIMTKINEIIDEIQFEEKSIKYWGHCKKLQALINNRDKQQQKKNNKHYLLYTNSTEPMINTTDKNTTEPKIVWNFSNRNLTEEELRVLEKGMSYNRSCTINRSKVISNVEYLFHQASKIRKESIDFKKWDEDPDDIANKEIRVLEPKQLSLAADLKNATEKFFQHAQMSIKMRKDKNLNGNNDDKILLKLSKDLSILITKPDKGRGVVILDRNDYIEKLEK